MSSSCTSPHSFLPRLQVCDVSCVLLYLYLNKFVPRILQIWQHSSRKIAKADRDYMFTLQPLLRQRMEVLRAVA